MMDNYTRLIQDNLDKLYGSLPANLEQCIRAAREEDRFKLSAFGCDCTIAPDGISFKGPDDSGETDPIRSLLVTLYALNATDTRISLTPFKAFKEFPDSMPYAGAFATHTEQLLAPHVSKIKSDIPKIMLTLAGQAAPHGTGGDFSFVVYPLPKIALCYIFYEADDDFPAGVTCLYSGNARQFMPVDGLADVGEYTSRRIIDLIS
ncbi:MAG: DUF3786 domain-containing protein [Desulfobacter sp.]|nr:MAG: DUF3786 domain-containing protein [Desulfobacter sp.]